MYIRPKFKTPVVAPFSYVSWSVNASGAAVTMLGWDNLLGFLAGTERLFRLGDGS